MLPRPLVAALVLALAGCEIELGPARGGDAQGGVAGADLWVYTSMYQDVIDRFDGLVRKGLPGATVHWYRAGSEKVAQRIDAELSGGATRADLVLTSDPFFYERLKREGRLRRYVSPEVLRAPREFVDPDGTWAISRASVMVIVFNRAALAGIAPPAAFRDLAEPRLRGKVAVPDPLLSGTSFTTMSFLAERYGWDYFRALRANGAISSGGNSAVLDRVVSGEVPVGLVCLENILQVQRRGAKVEIAYPTDGAVVIPGPVAILAGTRRPEAAEALVDLMLSPEGQRIVVAGEMYSADPRVAAPAGTPPFSELLASPFRWTPAFLERVLTGSKEIKATYAAVMHR